eukprot:m.175310 g.175310  ORF g.175310 m.175310 type:complete len:1047 (+) comp16775_c0_seq1:151-3291(+)
MDHPWIEKVSLLDQLHDVIVKARSEDGCVTEASQRQLGTSLIALLTHGVIRRPFIASSQVPPEQSLDPALARVSSWELVLRYLALEPSLPELKDLHDEEEVTQRELFCIGKLQRWLEAQLQARALVSTLEECYSDATVIAATYHPWAVMHVPYDRQRLIDDVKSVQRLRWQLKRTSVTWVAKPEGSPVIQPRLMFAQNNVQLLQYTSHRLTPSTPESGQSAVNTSQSGAETDQSPSTGGEIPTMGVTWIGSTGYLCLSPSDPPVAKATCESNDAAVPTPVLSALPEVLQSDGPHASLELAWWSNDVLSQDQTSGCEPGLDELPEGWDAGYDPATGATYYINHLDQVTTWVHPAITALQSQPTTLPLPLHRSLRLTLCKDFPVVLQVQRDELSTAAPSAQSSTSATPSRSRGSYADLVAVATGQISPPGEEALSGTPTEQLSAKLQLQPPTIAVSRASMSSQCESRGSLAETDAGLVRLRVMHTIHLADGQQLMDQHPSEVVEFYLSRGLQAFVGALRQCPFCTLQPNADWSLLTLEDGISPQRELQHVRQVCRTMAFGQISSRLYNWDKKAARPSEMAVSAEALQAFVNEDGSVADWTGLKKLVFFKGLRPSLRQQVWPWLLEVLDPHQPIAQQQDQQATMQEEYHRLKRAWSCKDATDASLLKLLRDVIKDTRRTDRGFEMFLDNTSEWLRAMLDILLTYTTHHGKPYCQGMSDILSPLLSITQDESVAYFCFLQLLKRFESTFDEAGLGVHIQLDLFRGLVEVLLPDIYNVLCQHDLIQMFFAYRWTVLAFKREFNLEQICDVWETVWCDHRTTNFTLFVAVAVLDLNRSVILDKAWQQHELMERLTSLPQGMDVRAVLARARQLLYQCLSLDLSSPLVDILRPFRSISSSNLMNTELSSNTDLTSPTSGSLLGLDLEQTNQLDTTVVPTPDADADQEGATVGRLEDPDQQLHCAWQTLLELSHEYKGGEVRQQVFGLYRLFSQQQPYRADLVTLADVMFDKAKKLQEPGSSLLKMLDALLRLAELTRELAVSLPDDKGGTPPP